MRKHQIEGRVAIIRSMPGFGAPTWWLTFYLTAPSQKLEAIAERLLAFQAINLGGTEGGFLYPKLPVSSDPQAVSSLIEQIEKIAASCSVEMLQVDADTSPDGFSSKFQEITRYG